jgi:DNA-binding NtrC family response regulator
MLPGMSGAELARAVLERRPELKVIVMSGYAPEDALPAGDPRVHFLAKPFGVGPLEAALRSALSPTPDA